MSMVNQERPKTVPSIFRRLARVPQVSVMIFVLLQEANGSAAAGSSPIVLVQHSTVISQAKWTATTTRCDG